MEVGEEEEVAVTVAEVAVTVAEVAVTVAAVTVAAVGRCGVTSRSCTPPPCTASATCDAALAIASTAPPAPLSTKPFSVPLR
jgi:hypothetical protein